jgi:hypothetical protein
VSFSCRSTNAGAARLARRIGHEAQTAEVDLGGDYRRLVALTD